MKENNPLEKFDYHFGKLAPDGKTVPVLDEQNAKEYLLQSLIDELSSLIEKIEEMESDRSGEEVNEERQSKVNTWDYGHNYALKAVKENIQSRINELNSQK